MNSPHNEASNKRYTKVLLFGSSGFVGGALYRSLTGAGYCVEGLTSKDCDLTDSRRVAEVLKRADGETCILFCSAVARIIEDSREAMWRNIEMVKNVLSGLPSGGVAGVIFFSSVDVYGSRPSASPLNEESPVSPSGYYGLSKWISELLLRHDDRARSFPVSVLRCPGIYGKGDQYRSVVGKFTELIKQKNEIVLTGDGCQLRDFVSVEDVCRVVLALLKKPFNGVLNIATGRSVPIRDIAQTIASKVNHACVFHYVKSQADRDFDLVFDTTKLTNTLPDTRFSSFEEQIEDYLRDF
ncbi:MAG: NAD(P)-dependent oxidoreductase [Candidatus Omnitrophica bacterium]|nr:NAD(P)-dependent oxidoreductase [Candidatus Omnitrophota bacterium]